MTRFAIKHKPTGKFLYEDEWGSFLVEEKEGFISFGDKIVADEMLSYISDETYVEDFEEPIPKSDFEVSEL